jgi:glycosyltransferase involved in cell wall biosynthesis
VLRLSIIIPAFNESQTIAEIINRVRRAPVDLERELIVVDDGSSDTTSAELDRLMLECPHGLRIFRHDRNRGKGAAVRTALAHARGDIILIQDADLELDPRDYPSLLKPILEGCADAVVGNRFHAGSRRAPYFWHALGNSMLTRLTNAVTGLRLSDMEAGYKAFRSDALKQLAIQSNRFGFEPEVVIKLATRGFRLHEVPITYHGRTYIEGKKLKWKDGAAAVFHIVRYRFFDGTRPTP